MVVGSGLQFIEEEGRDFFSNYSVKYDAVVVLPVKFQTAAEIITWRDAC